MWRRARTASWRHAASDRPTADAISAKPNPNTSRSTNTARSSGLSRSSSSRAAIDTESASSADRAGSSYGSVSSGSGNHGPTYVLPPDPRRAQHVDRDPGHHGREERLGRRGLGRGGLVAQPGLLDRVLGLAHAAQDPVGDREQQRPQLLELLGPGHASSSLKPCRHDG